jgi:AbrB family looped-hinge helix DNA binding protein
MLFDMTVAYATVKAKGQVVIPVDICRKFQIDEGTRVAFLEEAGRLFIQPVRDKFIDEMNGILSGRGLPDCLDGIRDRNLKRR